MAAWTYHVISTEVENHILKHDWLITHLCMHKQPTLTKQWKYFCANISYIVISDTLVASFLDVFFLTLALIFSEFHVNPWRKDSVSEKRNCICVSDFFDFTPSFLCHSLLLSSSTPFPFPSDVLTQWLYGDVLCDDIMSKRSKIWKSLAIYYSIYYFRLCFSFSCSGCDLTLTKKNNTLNCYSFLHKFLLETKITNSLLVTVIAQFTAKMTNSEKPI